MTKGAENPIKPCLTPIWTIKGRKSAVFLPCVCIGSKQVMALNKGLEHLSVTISFTASVFDRMICGKDALWKGWLV